MIDHTGQLIDAARIANAVVWLEEEQRQNRANFATIVSQMERFQVFLDEQADYSRHVEEVLVSIRQQLGRLGMVEEMATQTRDQLMRVDQLVAELEKSSALFRRLAETEMESLKAVDNEVQGVTLQLRGAVEQTEARLRSIDETERRRIDQVSLVESRLSEVLKLAEMGDQRSRAANEHLKRTQDDLEGMSAHLANLVTQDELLSSRLQVLQEHLRAIDDKVDKVAVEVEVYRPVPDRIDVLRAEHQRVAQEVGGLIQNYSHVNEKVDDLARQVRDQGSRNREAFDKMLGLRQEVWDFAQKTEETVVQMLRLEERQKRREITELEQQIKELRQQKGSLGQPQERPQ